MRTEAADWYDTPLYYDIIFDQDTDREASFLEGVMSQHGSVGKRKSLRVLEPACGSGRLVAEMVSRGHQVYGFDLNEHMLDYTRARLGARRKSKPVLWRDRLEEFKIPDPQPFQLAHCLVSTFKYVLTEKGAVAHLQRVAESLESGGLYVLGVHLTDYADTREQHERWKGERNGIQVVCNTHTWPPNQKARTEDIRTRLKITRENKTWVQETKWQFRTYNAREMRRLIKAAPSVECVACYDFTYDLSSQRELDDSYSDIVLVLKKR